MDCTIPVEIMIRGMKEIQMFLLSNPDDRRKLTEMLIISYALIKMVSNGLYGKTIECWKNIPAANKK